MNMYNSKEDQAMDKLLNIETTGLIEWPRGVNLDYFRTESSSYKDLDRLIKHYDFRGHSRLVDYGSGKGRIVFYFNYRLGIPTTGIEVNEVAFSHLTQNLANYAETFPKKAADIILTDEKAEEYEVKPTDDIFYFFNPFTISIFEKVMHKIEQSLEKHPREADIILYYPGVAYSYYLDRHSSFDLIQTIKNPKYFLNSRECFKVYRHLPH